VRFHDRVVTVVELAAALSQITNQFFATIELGAGRLVAVEIADQTNAERDVVQIIAVNMAAINLPAPAISHFDLAIAGRSAVADHEMIGEPVLHPPKMSMVIIERSGVSLTRSAVVNHNVLPATAVNWRAIDQRAH